MKYYLIILLALSLLTTGLQAQASLWDKLGNNTYNTNLGGNIGIGTPFPTERLDIFGNARVSGGFTALGNVGIGVTNPLQKLSIAGDVNLNGNVLMLDSTDITDVDHIWHSDVDNSWNFVSDVAKLGTGNGKLVAGYLNMLSTAESYFSGNVGIKTTNPSSTLEVVGSRVLDSGTEIGVLKLRDPSTSIDRDPSISAHTSGTGHPITWRLGSNSAFDGNIEFMNMRAGSLELGTSGTTRMAIYDSGNIAILSGSLTVHGGGGSFYGNVRPGSDDTYDLGSVGAFGPLYRFEDIYATSGTVNTSDKRDKENINKLKYGLKEIMQLKPVQYTWKKRPERGVKLGLIAQDVQEVLSEVVKSFDHERDNLGNVKRIELERLGIYYSDIIQVLIKAIQEQQEIIQNLEEKVTQSNQENQDLSNRVAKLEQALARFLAQDEPKLSSSNHIILEGKQETYLKQNQPNPFKGQTTIEYFIPTDIEQAELHITTQDGKVLKTMPIDSRGVGQTVVETRSMKSGAYFYTLILDGELFESKQMVLMN